MSKVIKSKHSSHRWHNKTRCTVEGRKDYMYGTWLPMYGTW